MEQPNQPIVNTQDPLAPFSNTPQQTEKYLFNGQQWDSKEACEAAYMQHTGGLAAKVDELEKRAQERAAQQTAVAQTQYVTGKEADTYKHDEYLAMLGKDGREATAYAFVEAIKSPNSPLGMFLRNISNVATQAQATVDQMQFQAAHPEIDWTNPKVVEFIDQQRAALGYAPDFRGKEAAIAILQRDRRLPTREDYQARMAQWQQQQAVPQQQQAYDPYGQPQYQQQNVVQMPQNYNPAPPVMVKGNARAPQGPINVQAALEKMNDPNTPVEEVRRIGDALRAMATQPASMVG